MNVLQFVFLFKTITFSLICCFNRLMCAARIYLNRCNALSHLQNIIFQLFNYMQSSQRVT